MADMIQLGQQGAHAVDPTRTLSDVTDPLAMPIEIPQPSDGRAGVVQSLVTPADVALPSVMPAQVALGADTVSTSDDVPATDTVPIAEPSMPAASDTSPPQQSPQSLPPRGDGGPTTAEQRDLPPTADATFPNTDRMKEVIADIFDFYVPGDPTRNDP